MDISEKINKTVFWFLNDDQNFELEYRDLGEENNQRKDDEQNQQEQDDEDLKNKKLNFLSKISKL